MAISKNDGLGYGQTWQNLTAQRALNVTYYNTTGKPKYINLLTVTVGDNGGAILDVNGINVYGHNPATGGAGFPMELNAIIPVNGSYKASNVGQSLLHWNELV